MQALSPSLITELDNAGILTATFDTPNSTINTLGAELYRALTELLEEVRNRNVHGLIFRSAKPGNFIAGADIEEVAEGMGMDKRIGRSFLKAGAGYGGSCFPKDASAFIWIAKKAGYDFNLLKEVEKINRGQRDMIVEKLENALWNLNGKTIGVLGIAFKPDTDDIRESPSVAVIKILLEEKARVKTYDPEAMKKAREVLKGVKFCSSPYEAARDSEALVLLTEWEEFRKMDLSKIKKLMKVPVFIDGRNLFKNKEMRSLGFIYQGVGR